ncbi:MAG: hypothetical protein MRZ19_01835, partial [Helicobacter sp.]|nr:hypothetical protein [Helicobacter sp.]
EILKPTKISPSSGNTNTEQNIYTLRENAKAHLKPRINKDIVNLNTQEVAMLTNKGIRKMISDKAVSKSVANGFSEVEHFKAVEQVTELFEKATKATSYKDPTDINLTIHRYNAPFENANALLTLKEYEQNGKKIYSLELDELNAIKFNPSGKDLMEQSPKSKDIDTASFNAPSENPNAILPKNSKINTQAQNNNNIQKKNKYQMLQTTSDYVRLAKEVMYAKQSLESRKAVLQQAIKENDKETIQWAKGAIADVEKRIKSSQQDLNKEIQRIKKLGISLENPLNLKTTPMPNIKMQELQAIYKNTLTSIESIDKQINSAKTQKQKDKLHKQRQDRINKFDKEMQALLKDFSKQRRQLMHLNLISTREETQELKSINFDFENPFGAYNLDKTIYRQEWGNADGNYHEMQLAEARIFFDRFEPLIRGQIKRNVGDVEGFSKGLIKDDDIFTLPFGTDLKDIRQNIEILYNIKPLQEFGTNYAEHYHSGESAIQKLLTQAQAFKESGKKGEYKGQVAGAFYREELGDIDLVWGKSYKDENSEWRGFGLAHILDKHGKEFKDLAKELSEVIEKGVLVKESDDKIILKSPRHTMILGKKENNKFVVTGYRQNNAKKLETTQTGGAGSFADETHPRNSLSSNQQEIIPQTTQQAKIKTKENRENSEQSLAQTKLSPSAQAKKDEVLESKIALYNKQAKQIYEFFTAKGTNKDKIKTLENFKVFMSELNRKLDGQWKFAQQQKPDDLAKYKQILTQSIEQAQQAGISASQKERFLQDLDLFIDNFSYIKTTGLYNFHQSQASQILHKIQYKAYQLYDLSDDEFMKILLDKKLPKALHEDFDRELNKRKDRIYPFLKPMLAKDNYFEYIGEQKLKDFFYKGALRDDAIPQMIAKEKGVKIQDFEIDSPRQRIEQALNIKPIKEFGTNYAEFYHDGPNAIKKLLAERQGQVAGAFYRE